MSVKQDISNKRFFSRRAVKKIIILTLSMAVIGFCILFTFFNYRSTEKKIKELFGIDMEAYALDKLWCVTDRGKGTHGGHVSIVPNEEGYYVHLIYGEC